jgi:hypothetical protein
MKSLRNELHHWWPECVSRFWADTDGHAYMMTPDGNVVRSLPGQFGAIRNAHTIKLAKKPTVWDESFEGVFGSADSNFGALIAWLGEVARADGPTLGAFDKRLSPLLLSTEQHSRLADCMASLIVRSPRFRFCIRLTTEHYRARFGMPDPTADKSLIAMNMRNCQKTFRDAIASGGKFLVMSSAGREFIFGDGFLHNFTSSAAAPHSPRFLIPVTPEIAVYYVKPMAYRSFPKAFAMTLLPEEVKAMNDIVQVYSERFLFYRREKPETTDEFRRGEHRQLQYDDHPSLRELGHAMGETYFGPDALFSRVAS